jgi:hypothetical protein
VGAGQSMKGFLIQMGDGLHVISRRLLQLWNKPLMCEVMFKIQREKSWSASLIREGAL